MFRDLPATGADLVVLSGGKSIRGPQGTGIVLGKAERVHAARMNGSPNAAVGRAMKVGKEEIIGLVTALELYLEEDDAAEARLKKARLATIASALNGIAGIRVTYDPPEDYRYYPSRTELYVVLEPSFPRTLAQVREALLAGEPSVLVRESSIAVRIRPDLFKDGDAEAVGQRLREVLE